MRREGGNATSADLTPGTSQVIGVDNVYITLSLILYHHYHYTFRPHGVAADTLCACPMATWLRACQSVVIIWTDHIRGSQVEMIAATATAVAVSTFRRDREMAEQRRARSSGDPLDPGAKFAIVVHVGALLNPFSGMRDIRNP